MTCISILFRKDIYPNILTQYCLLFEIISRKTVFWIHVPELCPKMYYNRRLFDKETLAKCLNGRTPLTMSTFIITLRRNIFKSKYWGSVSCTHLVDLIIIIIKSKVINEDFGYLHMKFYWEKDTFRKFLLELWTLIGWK